MDSKRILEVVLTALVAVFLVVAAEGRHPYGFYMVLRLTVTVGAIYWAVRVYDAGPKGWLWAFIAVALLLNPILPVRMHRTDWAAHRPVARSPTARLGRLLGLKVHHSEGETLQNLESEANVAVSPQDALA